MTVKASGESWSVLQPQNQWLHEKIFFLLNQRRTQSHRGQIEIEGLGAFSAPTSLKNAEGLTENPIIG